MTLASKVDQFTKDSDLAHQIVHAPRGTVVETEGGLVPSLATAMGDATEAKERISALEAGQAAGRIVAKLWQTLQSVHGAANMGASVVIDAGTHIDPVSGSVVANQGDYIWNDQVGAWEWIRADGLALKADQAELTELASAVSDFKGSFSFESLAPAPDHIPVLDPDGRQVTEIPYRTVGQTHFETLSPDLVPILMDADQRVLIPNPKAAQTEAPQTAFVPPQAPGYRLDRLRRTALSLGAIEAGYGGHRHHITLFGDSWGDVANYFLRSACSSLRKRYGDGGLGYVDTTSGVFLRPELSRVVSGWTPIDTGVPGPALYLRSGGAGAKITLTCTDAQPISGAELIYEGTSDGAVSYRWNGGEQVTVALTGQSMAGVALERIPAGRSWSLEITVTAGTVRIAGVNFNHAADGIVLNKCANSGTRTLDWTAVDAASWEAGISRIPTDLVVMLWGTNDVRDGLTPTAYSNGIREMIRRTRSAHPPRNGEPGPDVMVIIPPEVWRAGAATPMAPYRDAILAIADELDIALLDLTHVLGNPYDRRAWFDSDGVHPVEATSGHIIARAFVNSLS